MTRAPNQELHNPLAGSTRSSACVRLSETGVRVLQTNKGDGGVILNHVYSVQLLRARYLTVLILPCPLSLPPPLPRITHAAIHISLHSHVTSTEAPHAGARVAGSALTGSLPTVARLGLTSQPAARAISRRRRRRLLPTAARPLGIERLLLCRRHERLVRVKCRARARARARVSDQGQGQGQWSVGRRSSCGSVGEGKD